MKTFLAVFLLIVTILAIILLSVVSENVEPPNKQSPSSSVPSVTFEGTIEDISSNNSLMTLLTADNEEFSISSSDQTTLKNLSGKVVPLSYLNRGFSLRVDGKKINPNTINATSITITEEPNIVLYTPKNGATVTNTFVVSGNARVFENTVSLTIRNLRTNKILLTGILEAQAQDVGQYGPFEKEIVLSPSNLTPGDKLEIKVFQASAKDGSETDVKSSTVIYDKNARQTVKIFFTNDAKNPKADCGIVFSVPRDIPVTKAIARTTLSELLEGPTEAEVIQGYGTAINDNVTIRSLIIKDNTAYVDLSEEIQKNLGGSCRVTAIRSQIEQTLKQFPSVKNVEISVNGKSESILQP